jgi:hypothetical protein
MVLLFWNFALTPNSQDGNRKVLITSAIWQYIYKIVTPVNMHSNIKYISICIYPYILSWKFDAQRKYTIFKILHSNNKKVSKFLIKGILVNYQLNYERFLLVKVNQVLVNFHAHQVSCNNFLIMTFI